MDNLPGQSARSWFRDRGGRRYARELALVVAVKIALLLLIWFALIAPQPRADTSPAAVERHLVTPAATAGIAHD